jgi:D-alanine-D-alanine ligase
MGGPDAEHEVSLMSGRQVAQALRDSLRFEVIEQVIDQPTVADLQYVPADVIFPVLHGPWGEGGPLQEVLELLGLPYVGSGPQAAAMAMDKPATKSIVRHAGIRTPADCLLEAGVSCSLELPLVLKPIDDGSSVDLHICRTQEQLTKARETMHARRGAVMAEQFIAGREVTAGIVCGEPTPLIEIIPSPEVAFYDYQAKYIRDDTRYELDPQLPPGAADECTEAAVAAFDLLGCRDVARADFIVNDEGAWFLEINTMPGFTTHSLLPMAARPDCDMPWLCGRLVESAMARMEVQAPATHG